MKRPIKLILATAMLGISTGTLAGCGDTFDGLTINFWHTFGSTVLNGVDSAAKAFAKKILDEEGVNLRIKLTYKGGYDDLKGELEKAITIGDNPTMAVAYPDHVADYFAIEEQTGTQYVVDLSKYANDPTIGFGKESFLGDIPTATFDDFQDAYQEEATSFSKEGMYVLPLLKSTELLMYNITLLKKAAPYVSYTWSTDDDIMNTMSNISWDEFMDLCEEIKNHMAEISNDLLWPLYYDSDANLLISHLMQSNIPYSYIKDGHGVIGFDGSSKNLDPTPEQEAAYGEVKDSLQKFKEWYDLGLFQTKGVYGEYGSKYFVPGQCIFTVGSSGGSGYSFPATSTTMKPVATKVPYFNNNPLYVSQGISIALFNNIKLQKSGENDTALKYGWKFLKYITNPELNADLAANHSEGYTPVRKSALETKTYSNFLKTKSAYAEVANTVIGDINFRFFNTAVFKGSPVLRDNMANIFADVMKLGKNPKMSSIIEKLDKGIENANQKM